MKTATRKHLFWPGSKLHPRPQFRRRDESWISLNGEWKFQFDDGLSCFSPADVKKWEQVIQVPYAPETEKSGIGDTSFHPCCWYERTFEVEKTNDRFLLNFGAVDYCAHVWINDQLVGSHEGGHTPFVFDITAFLTDSGPQKLTVRVEDDPHDLTKPRGKQDWQKDPHSIWYPRTTGIWQSVWLERVPPVYVDRIRWTPHVERWEVGFSAYIKGVSPNAKDLRVKLFRDEELLAEDRYRIILGEVHRQVTLSDPGIDDFRNELLWSPERPTLIRAELELWENETLLDKVFSYTALRSATIHGDRFMLNGRPYPLRLVLDQGYWPDSFMSGDDDKFQTDIELTKAMGFNGVRKHQKIEDPRYLFWADVMGLLVWEEMPSAYRFTHESVERLVREWTEVIDRDYSHPCIVVWVPFNESWGVPDLQDKVAHRHCVQAMYHLTKTLDPTRPAIGNDGWESVATDIIGIHDYDGDIERFSKRYDPKIDVAKFLSGRGHAGRLLTIEGHAHAGKPVMLTEFGGIAFLEDEEREKNWGYTITHSRREYRERLEKLFLSVNSIDLFSGYCYTQLTDTFQEKNGLVGFDRKPKLPTEVIAMIVRGKECQTHEMIVPVPPPTITFS